MFPNGNLDQKLNLNLSDASASLKNKNSTLALVVVVVVVLFFLLHMLCSAQRGPWCLSLVYVVDRTKQEQRDTLVRYQPEAMW